jgi:hypothetical protein
MRKQESVTLSVQFADPTQNVDLPSAKWWVKGDNEILMLTNDRPGVSRLSGGLERRGRQLGLSSSGEIISPENNRKII